ncbi:MAG: LamG domain-containing protein, partial [Acidobacteriia bacterium]|nr:LamG domain-containing protein [Terriglobia bacterium]
GGAASLNGGNAWISVSNFPKASGGKTTGSAWVKANSAPVWASILKNWALGPGELHLGLDNGSGRLSIYTTQSNRGIIGPVIDGSSFSLGVWQYVTFVADGAAVHLYLNGAEVGTPAAYNGTLMTTLPCLGIGAKPNDTCTGADPGFPGFWNGLIDEARIFNTNLSAGRIATDYNNQSSPGTFYTVGAQE